MQSTHRRRFLGLALSMTTRCDREAKGLLTEPRVAQESLFRSGPHPLLASPSRGKPIHYNPGRALIWGRREDSIPQQFLRDNAETRHALIVTNELVMSSPSFEVLAYEDTPLGPLCLQRRMTLSEPRELVTEITLNHEFLMSSLHTDSERALAALSLVQCDGDQLRVLIGGLGLGYTAQAALADRRVSRVVVIEFLPQVIRWLREGLVPLADELNDEPRLSVVEGDVYAGLLSAPTDAPFDVILIDVDHSPDDRLDPTGDAFYTPRGLSLASRHLRPGGVFGMWSYEQSSSTLDAMRQSLTEVSAGPVPYYNRHVHEEFTDWVYTGRRGA